MSGKSALFLGDSITAGVCDTKNIYSCNGWAGRIGYYGNMGIAVNNGVSGACITTSRIADGDKYYIYNNLVKETGKTYDYVIMHGLINDYFVNARLGEPQGKANFDPNTVDESTFAGAFELLLYTAKTQHPNAKLGFIVNFKLDDGPKEYVDMAIQICEDWGISYLDLYNDSTVQVALEDGLHPSSKGYDNIYVKIAEWMAAIQ